MENNTDLHFSGEELGFLVDMLELEQADAHNELESGLGNAAQSGDVTDYLHRLEHVQQSIEQGKNLEAMDFILLYEVTRGQRGMLEQALDTPGMPSDARAEGQQSLRMANNIIRRLKKRFASFGIEV